MLVNGGSLPIGRALQAGATILVASLGFGALGLTLLAIFGVVPWLDFTARFDPYFVPEAGKITQVAVTALLLSLLAFLPAARRVMQLEAGHRAFNMRMEDVARAYHLCHTADRAGVFSLSSEFDSVRERLAYLRDHPDLEGLEPDLMEVAAQMSQQARHLADVYSDEKVARAKAFLKHRQQEVERQQERIVEAQHACRDIKSWAEQLDVEENVVAAQLEKLEEQLVSLLPALGYRVEKDDTVITFADRTAAE